MQSDWQPRWPIRPEDRVLTAGSCFAQHIGRALTARGWNWVETDPAPPGLDVAARAAGHYGSFSFRTGNIYTSNLLAQWLSWAVGDSLPPDFAWEDAAGCVDPFRPAVGAFADRASMLAARAELLARMREGLAAADVLVFTLGLTESWQFRDTGIEYAVCPGTLAGRFRPRRHRFVNQDAAQVAAALRRAIGLSRQVNPGLRWLLTVSPVPLTATASGDHVLVATGRSKAILRAAAAEIVAADPATDYFPAWEIVTDPAAAGRFYAANARSVRPEGVAEVMGRFFAAEEAARPAA